MFFSHCGLFMEKKHPPGNFFVQKNFHLCNINYPLPFLGGPKKAIFLHKIPPLPKMFLWTQGKFLVGGVFYAKKLLFLDHPEMIGGNLCCINKNIFSRKYSLGGIFLHKIPTIWKKDFMWKKYPHRGNLCYKNPHWTMTFLETHEMIKNLKSIIMRT